MAWVKVDDTAPEHPKFLMLGRDRLAGIGLWLVGLAYSNRYLTDGFIPAGALPGTGDVTKLAARLVAVCLWERVQGGYRIHDYSDYQPSREETEALRATRAEAGRKGGRRSGSTRSSKAEANASASAQAPGTKQTEANVNPVPSRTRIGSLNAGRVPTAEAPATNGVNPPDDQSPTTGPDVEHTEAGAVRWLTWLWGTPPTDEQMVMIREVVDRADADAAKRGTPGWEWLIERVFKQWPKVKADYRDPLTYMLELDRRWKQKVRRA